MKRALSLLVLASTLVLYACGGSTPQPTATPTSASATPTSPPPSNATSTTAQAPATKAPPSASTATSAPVSTAPTPTAVTLVVPVATPPVSVTASITPPALPAASTFDAAPGTGADQAVQVTVPVTISEKTKQSDTHWYRLDLSKYNGGTLVLDFAVPRTASGNMSISLADAAGVTVMETDSVAPGGSKEVVSQVESKAYEVKVAADGGFDSQNPYTLAATFHPNSTNSDKSTAVKLGPVGTGQGMIASTTDIQWFALDMSAFPQGGEITATLQAPAKASGPYRLVLYDPEGTQVLQSQGADPGGTGQIVQEVAQATNYYFAVKSDGGYDWTDPYVLATVFTPHSPYGAPKAALDIIPPVLAKVHMVTPQDVTYLKLQISAASVATATVNTPADGSNVLVGFTDAAGENSYSSNSVGPGQQATITASLDNAGTYLVKIAGNGGAQISKDPVEVDVRIEQKPGP